MKNLIKDILVIQLAKMGDILQTTPLLYRIREKYPEAGLALLVDSTFAEVSSGVQFVDEVIPFDLTSIHCVTNDSKLSLFEKYTYLVEQLAPVRERRFDIIYNINFSKMTAILSQFFRDSMIIGYRLQPKTGAILKTGWAGLIFHLMRYRKMVRFNLADLWASYENGLSKPARRLFYDCNGTGDIQVDLPVDSPVIGLQMGCGGDLRRWPVRYFASLAKMLVQSLGARLVFFGSKMEGNLGRKFRDEWHRVAGDTPLEDHSDDLIGKTTIPQLAATLKMCDLLISGDTGTMHLSAAVGTRVVGLFMGTASCHETGPYGEGHFVLQPLAPCFPCAEGNSPCREPACRTIIQPEVVYDLVRAILKEKDGTGLELPDCSDHIQIYRTSMDEWGVKFLPFVRREVDIGEIMAVAYREVGRKLMRPAYTIDLSGIAGELKGYYGGIAVNTLERLSLVLMNLSLLDSICKSGFGRGGHESFATVEEKIRRICGSLDVIMPLYGYFKELKSEEESNSGLGGKSAQLAARAISGTLRQLSAILQNTGLRL